MKKNRPKPKYPVVICPGVLDITTSARFCDVVKNLKDKTRCLKRTLSYLHLIEDKKLQSKIAELVRKSGSKKKITVVVHNGLFHADDIFACVLLGEVFGFSSLKIIRTRDEKYFEKADFVVDVGKIYDAGENWKYFDHHQQLGFNRANGWPYAAFGLIWRSLGILMTGDQEIADQLENVLVMHVDATDCGYIPDSKALAAWKVRGGEILEVGGLSRKQKEAAFEKISDFLSRNSRSITGYSVSKAISAFNNNWDENERNTSKNFIEAMKFARQILEREVTRLQSNKNGGKELSNLVLMSGNQEILVLDKYVPLNSDSLVESNIKYIIFPDSGNDGQWDVKCVPTENGGFESKIPFPAEWGASENTDLQRITGIKDAVFCHKSRFIAGARSVEGAKALAELSLLIWKSAGNK